MSPIDCIDLDFDLVIYFNDSLPKFEKNFELQNILRQHKLFQPQNILPKTSLKYENELVVITLLRDRVYQLYSKHILDSNIINNTRERLRKKDFIGKLIFF